MRIKYESASYFTVQTQFASDLDWLQNWRGGPMEITPDVPLPHWQEIDASKWRESICLAKLGVRAPDEYEQRPIVDTKTDGKWIQRESTPEEIKKYKLAMGHYDGKWTPTDGHAIGEPKGPGRVECSCGWPGPPASADAGLYPGSVGWNDYCLKAWLRDGNERIGLRLHGRMDSTGIWLSHDQRWCSFTDQMANLASGRAAGPGGRELPADAGSGHSASEGAKAGQSDGKAERP
jgi:hypothetical protein